MTTQNAQENLMTTITISDVQLLIRLARNELSTTENWLYQAKRAFRDYTPEQMLQEHGESGSSRADIIARYQESRDRAHQVLQELEHSV